MFYRLLPFPYLKITVFRNLSQCQFLLYYKVEYPRRQSSSYSQPREPENSLFHTCIKPRCSWLYVILNRCNLFYRSNPETPFNTSVKNMSLDGSYYNASKETVILLSGWLMTVDGEYWAPVGPAILSNVSAVTAYEYLDMWVFLPGCLRIS
jgi:hypothetical protein